MKNNLSLLLFMSLIVLAISACNNAQIQTASKESSGYERVMKTGVIRCGYLIYPPLCMKDPDIGKLTGFFVEVMERVGRKLGLKVTWPEEVGYENIFEGLKANRYDVFGGGLWPNANRAKAGDFSIPLFYNAVNAYGRTSDHRFDNNLGAVNSPDIKIAVIDGATEDVVAKADFPLAKRLSLPELSNHSQNFWNVITKKADVTFAAEPVPSMFLKSNPGTIKNLLPNHPVRVFGAAIVFKIGDLELKDMINTVLEELINSGEIDKLIKKYQTVPDAFYPVAPPYRTH